jgi:hypothetical protein
MLVFIFPFALPRCEAIRRSTAFIALEGSERMRSFQQGIPPAAKTRVHAFAALGSRWDSGDVYTALDNGR